MAQPQPSPEAYAAIADERLQPLSNQRPGPGATHGRAVLSEVVAGGYLRCLNAPWGDGVVETEQSPGVVAMPVAERRNFRLRTARTVRKCRPLGGFLVVLGLPGLVSRERYGVGCLVGARWSVPQRAVLAGRHGFGNRRQCGAGGRGAIGRGGGGCVGEGQSGPIQLVDQLAGIALEAHAAEELHLGAVVLDAGEDALDVAHDGGVEDVLEELEQDLVGGERGGLDGVGRCRAR